MDAKPTKEVLSPIYTRLKDEQSLLRRSGDVSMLVQAILDTGKLFLTTYDDCRLILYSKLLILLSK